MRRSQQSLSGTELSPFTPEKSAEGGVGAGHGRSGLTAGRGLSGRVIGFESAGAQDFAARDVVVGGQPQPGSKELVEMAEREGVSLNTYVNVALGKTVGQERKSKFTELDLAA